jgi:uncharacterized protein (TIGR03067 family)
VRHLPVALLSLSLLGAAPPQPDDVDPEPTLGPKAATRAIQGTWRAVKLEHNGRVNRGAFREAFWVFKGKQVTLRGEGGREFFKGTFVLGRDQRSNTIDITWTEGHRKGGIQKGIYTIGKGVLKMSQGAGERPKGFAGAGEVGKPGLLTLERVKPE